MINIQNRNLWDIIHTVNILATTSIVSFVVASVVQKEKIDIENEFNRCNSLHLIDAKENLINENLLSYSQNEAFYDQNNPNTISRDIKVISNNHLQKGELLNIQKILEEHDDYPEELNPFKDKDDEYPEELNPFKIKTMNIQKS